jgi:hypothetical protein
MNCQEFWNSMPELAEPASLAGSEHLDYCAACAARLRGQRALQSRLRALAGLMGPIAAPARVESGLRMAFRAHAGIEPYRPASASSRRRWAPILTWAAAAAVVFGLAISLARVQRPELLVLSRDIEPPMTEGDAPAADSGFIALPNAEQIGPNEDINLVRVELPRSAMIALGFAVGAGRAPGPVSELVQADVMLGDDGLARAVRFLD